MMFSNILSKEKAELKIKHKNFFFTRRTAKGTEVVELVNITCEKVLIAADVEMKHAEILVSAFNTRQNLSALISKAKDDARREYHNQLVEQGITS